MSFFGEDFLIKLGFDIDKKEIEKLRTELKNLQTAAQSRVRIKKSQEVETAKNLLSIERKRLQIRKKLDRLRELGHKGSLGRYVGTLQSKDETKLSERNLELDELLRVATKEAREKAKVERKATSEEKAAKISQKEAAKEAARALKLAAHRIKSVTNSIVTGGTTGGVKASKTLFADILREEEKDARSIQKNFDKAAKDSKKIERAKRKELEISRRQTRLMRKAVNDFAHAFGAITALYSVFATIRDAQQVKFGAEQATTQMQVAFGDKAEDMIQKFIGSVEGLNLGIGRLQAMQTISQVAPALRGRFTEEESTGIAQELLLVSKFSGQMNEMAAVARNFAQITTSLEGEDVNQFADRFTGLMPFIYQNLVEMGKITEASRGAFLKAKELGNVVSKDFIQAFRKSVQRIKNDDKLRETLSGKLTVAWDALLASIQDARLSFMGVINEKDNRTSLTEQLKESYDILSAFFKRSARTWRAWGEVLGTVIRGLTFAFLKVEEMYLRFAIWLKNTFGMDDDAARRAAIWTALGVVMLPVIALLTKLALKVKTLFTLFGRLIPTSKKLGEALVALRAGFLKNLKGFGAAIGKISILPIITNVIESLMAGLNEGFTSPEFIKEISQLGTWIVGLLAAPFTMGLSLLAADFITTLMETWEGKKGIIDNLIDGAINWFNELFSFLPDSWKISTRASDKAESDRKSAIINSAYGKMYGDKFQPVGSSSTEKQIGSKGLGGKQGNVNSVTATDSRTITNNYTIQESDRPMATANAIVKTNYETSISILDRLAINGG